MDFMNLQMLKIGCVNYTHFPKSGHIYIYIYIYLYNKYIANIASYIIHMHAVTWKKLQLQYKILASSTSISIVIPLISSGTSLFTFLHGVCAYRPPMTMPKRE